MKSNTSFRTYLPHFGCAMLAFSTVVACWFVGCSGWPDYTAPPQEAVPDRPHEPRLSVFGVCAFLFQLLLYGLFPALHDKPPEAPLW